MIVYNVARRWFPDKNGAEQYRIISRLKPSATVKVTVEDRSDLCHLLNALCDPPFAAKPVAVAPVELIDRAFVDPHRSVPDCVPLFLIDKADRDAVAADRMARGAA